jgi:class 3 adenylate cyclase
VSIALGARDFDAARSALEELESLGPIVQSAAHQAALEGARGEVALAEDRADDAITLLRRAIRGWCEVEAPYEAAQVRTVIALAYESASDVGAARREREAALATFERLGAARDAEQLRAILETPEHQRATRTFMFTDIVDSTKMLDVVGDQSWNDLLRWHDRTLRACFDRHDGEEIKHEGDGFFVAFISAKAALDCSIEIQRLLATHRREHGFAPRVRIGIHACEATRYGKDYTGRGVHETARIAASAEAAEILVSLQTIQGLTIETTNRRSLSLRGFAEPVPVAGVDWTPTS